MVVYRRSARLREDSICTLTLAYAADFMPPLPQSLALIVLQLSEAV
jgi:hypothetical protein